MTKVIETREAMTKWVREAKANGFIGFVPTMGALHEGHAELVRRAKAENTSTILSIFVNPHQFNNADDFSKYPKTWDADLALANKLGVDVVFAPAPDVIYPDQYRYAVIEKNFSKELCGAHRPGHFEGVLTVVMKLFGIVQPDRVYFGEKDYQQLDLIQGMLAAFFMPIQMVPVKTVRDENGLALSSRNLRLTVPGRVKASQIFHTLRESGDDEMARQQLTEKGFEVEYVETRRGRRYAAVVFEGVRLIDNVELGQGQRSLLVKL